MTVAIKKVIITGPESTGKSTLSQLLASHYQTLWVPEYAREYLQKHGPHYAYEDLVPIAKGQVQLQQQVMEKISASDSIHPPLMFVDTDMYVMKVWSEYVFGKVDTFITEQLGKQEVDLYLLCNVDLPWEEDELREYPDLESRQELFNIYQQYLLDQPVPVVVIEGNHQERLQKAIAAVDALFFFR